MIHTVGPTWAKTKDKSATLRSCYLTSLDVAAELGAASVAFPLISAGVYRWPKEDAVRQAFDAVAQSPHTGVDTVLVLFDEETLRLAQALADG